MQIGWWKTILSKLKTHGYGSIPINTIFRGMNIHLPAILMFTRGTRFWHTATCFFSGSNCWCGDGILSMFWDRDTRGWVVYQPFWLKWCLVGGSIPRLMWFTLVTYNSAIYWLCCWLWLYHIYIYMYVYAYIHLLLGLVRFNQRWSWICGAVEGDQVFNPPYTLPKWFQLYV